MRTMKKGVKVGNSHTYTMEKLHVFLSLLFNCMIVHRHTRKDVLASTTISIPKDMRASLCKSYNYRGISLFNAICKVFDYVIMYLCDDFYIHLNCNLDLNKIIPLFYAV